MAMQPLPVSAPDPRPLFGGYTLVAVTLAWLAGIALRAVGPLPGVPAVAWMIVAALAIFAAVALSRWRPPSATNIRRALLMGAILLVALTLGAARTAWADPANDPDAISHLPMNVKLKLQGEVGAEPDIRGGLRYLLVDVSAVSLDGGAT